MKKTLHIKVFEAPPAAKKHLASQGNHQPAPPSQGERMGGRNYTAASPQPAPKLGSPQPKRPLSQPDLPAPAIRPANHSRSQLRHRPSPRPKGFLHIKKETLPRPQPQPKHPLSVIPATPPPISPARRGISGVHEVSCVALLIKTFRRSWGAGGRITRGDRVRGASRHLVRTDKQTYVAEKNKRLFIFLRNRPRFRGRGYVLFL